MIDIGSSFWHIFSAFLVFVLGLAASLLVGQKFHLKLSRIIVLYLWHSLFCIAYLQFSLDRDIDALGYYDDAQSFDFQITFGTEFVTALTAVMVQGFGLSVLGAFLSYNVVGTFGLLAFDACLKRAADDKEKWIRLLATIVIFLPSVSFWSAAIGKDALAFMATGFALWAALSLGRRWALMALAVFIMLLVRPHIAAIMVIALTISFLFDANVSRRNRVILAFLAAMSAAAIIPLVLRTLGDGLSLNFNEVREFLIARQTLNMDGTMSVDIGSMSIPMQLFTYMFRPFLGEGFSAFEVAAGIDNLFLFIIFLLGGYHYISKKHIHLEGNKLFMWIYALLSWLILATTTANLGISLRQKWMFVPMLIFICISAMGKRKKAEASDPEPLAVAVT